MRALSLRKCFSLPISFIQGFLVELALAASLSLTASVTNSRSGMPRSAATVFARRKMTSGISKVSFTIVRSHIYETRSIACPHQTSFWITILMIYPVHGCYPTRLEPKGGDAGKKLARKICSAQMSISFHFGTILTQANLTLHCRRTHLCFQTVRPVPIFISTRSAVDLYHPHQNIMFAIPIIYDWTFVLAFSSL